MGKDLEILMMVVWGVLCLVSLIILTIGIFDGYSSTIQPNQILFIRVSFITLIVGIPTLIALKRNIKD